MSTRSCPPRTSPPSDLEEEDEGNGDRGSVTIITVLGLMYSCMPVELFDIFSVEDILQPQNAS